MIFFKKNIKIRDILKIKFSFFYIFLYKTISEGIYIMEEKYAALLDAIVDLKKAVTEAAIQKMITMGLYSFDMDSRRELDELTGMMKCVFDRFQNACTIDGELRKLSLFEKEYSYRIADQPIVSEPTTISQPIKSAPVSMTIPQDNSTNPVSVAPVSTTEVLQKEDPVNTKTEEIMDDISDTAITPPISEVEIPIISNMTSENRIAASELVYDQYILNLSHPGNNNPQKVKLHIAPLEISEMQNPNVPILVHAYTHGTFVNASSLDTEKSSRSMVTIEIDGFHLLCRGSFDQNGKFVSYVMTTGDSATQGDILSIVEHSTGADGPVTGQGHVIIHSKDNSTTEIFPLSKTENSYVIIEQSKDNGNSTFLDYYTVGKDYGMPKAVFFENGVKKQIIAGWEGDFFEAEVVY